KAASLPGHIRKDESTDDNYDRFGNSTNQMITISKQIVTNRLVGWANARNAPCPPCLARMASDGGHASLCPPYALLPFATYQRKEVGRLSRARDISNNEDRVCAERSLSTGGADRFASCRSRGSALLPTFQTIRGNDSHAV